MPKKVTVSLSGIIKQIDRTEGQLSRAKSKTTSRPEKKKLEVKIKNLKKIKKQVREICKAGGLTVAVPTA